MVNQYLSPALADLSQDIAGAVPVDIVKNWIAGNNTEREARRALMEDRIPCTIGIDSGGVVVFPREDGTSEIAGSPVNIASKMATDFGKPGNSYITETIAKKATLPESNDKFCEKISPITINGYVFR